MKRKKEKEKERKDEVLGLENMIMYMEDEEKAGEGKSSLLNQ